MLLLKKFFHRLIPAIFRHPKKIVLFSFFPFFFSATPHFVLTKTSFDHLPHWQLDTHEQALMAFKQSCSEILRRDPNSTFGVLSQNNKNHDWQRVCLAAMKLNKADKQTAQHFFEYWFVPYLVKDNSNSLGLFTGYYLPLLNANLQKTKQYKVPIYGLLKYHRFYPSRAAINRGALQGKAPILMWSDNLIDLFFAQIQGSAIIKLPNRKQFLIGYAGNNGHPYTPVGRILFESEQIPKDQVNMESIRAWLAQHPNQVDALLNQNASYVFFKILKNNSPMGTEQVPLTSERSLAVDTHYIPLGAPVWLDTFTPQYQTNKVEPFQHLLIAQDTGGAIKGMIRGDVYWGFGDKAAFRAGHMRSAGQYWILLPKEKIYGSF